MIKHTGLCDHDAVISATLKLRAIRVFAAMHTTPANPPG
jgi:hypothetical protein